MDFRKALLANFTAQQRSKIVRHVGADPARYSKLVEILFDGPYRITQRAAACLSIITQAHPQLAKRHVRKFVRFASLPGLHDSIPRNILRLLQFVDVPAKDIDVVFAFAHKALSDKSRPVAIHVFAMTVLANLVKQFPELGPELKIIIEDRMPYSSAAFLSRGKKVLANLKSQSADRM